MSGVERARRSFLLSTGRALAGTWLSNQLASRSAGAQTSNAPIAAARPFNLPLGAPGMKIICVEEHAIDADMGKVVGPPLMKEAPYMAFTGSEDVIQARDPHRPTQRGFKEASALAAELGPIRLSAMDEEGIDMQIVSYVTPAQLAPKDQAVLLTQAANNRLAKVVRDHPERFAGFAVLPWQDPHAAAEELTRCVNELGFKGALIAGRPGTAFLDAEQYAPVLKRLNELKVPLYVHPFTAVPAVQSVYYGGFSPEVSAQFSLSGWGWHQEAGVHVLRLILAGVFDKYPDLQVLSGHWGEMVPFFLQRLDDTIPPKVSGLSGRISETYRRHVWVTPSGMFDLPHFEFIYKTIGPDRIIWSVDYPYVTMDGTRQFLEQLPVSSDDRAKIAHGNAEKLLRL